MNAIYRQVTTMTVVKTINVHLVSVNTMRAHRACFMNITSCWTG